MPQDNTQGTLSSMIPQGTPSAPVQQPPSFGQKLLGNKEYSVEINDAVMETEAWKSSRYNGRQLEASRINQFTKGDKTYGKTAVVEKYSKNIYVGNRVIGHDSTPTFDNPNPGFSKKSFINVEGYYTINSDDTVSRVGVNFNDINSRKGFERSFREDFSIGTKASITILDKGVEHKLKNTYTVDFNEGLLSRVIQISGSAVGDIFSFGSDTSTINNDGTIFPSVVFSIQISNPSFTSSSITVFDNNQSKYYSDVNGSGTNIWHTGSTLIENFNTFFDTSKNEYLKSPSSNKFYMEFISPRGMNPYEFNTFSEGLKQVNTFEIDFNSAESTTGSTNAAFSGRFKNITQFTNPNAIGSFHFYSFNDPNTTPGNVNIYKLDPIPSLLIDMIKEEELPNGIGEQGFIVIPENFDPMLKPLLNKILKDKLNFDIEGGVNTNDDTNPFLNKF